MLDDPKGYYARLGVPSSATAEVLKSAFRQRAKSLHPDNPVSGSEDGFRRLMEAYDVLGDASARARYDDEVRRARREEEARRVKEASGTPRYRQSPHPAGPGFMHMPPMPKARVTWGWMIGLVAACAALAYGAVLLDGGWRALPFGRHSAETPVPPGPPSYYVAAGPDLDFWTQDRQSLMFSFAGRLPQFTSREAVRQGLLVPVLAEYTNNVIGMYAVYPHRRHLSGKVRAFVDYLAGWFERNRCDEQ